MTSPRLSVLRRQLKVPASTPAAAPAAEADDLATMLQAMVDAAVAKHLSESAAKPQQGSRLHALEAKLAMAQVRPAMPPLGLRVPEGEVSSVVPNLRQLFVVPDMPQHHPGVPDAEPINEIVPASKPMPMQRMEIRIAQRDHNGFIRTVMLNSEAGERRMDILARDPNNRIAEINMAGAHYNVRHDDLREVILLEPVLD